MYKVYKPSNQVSSYKSPIGYQSSNYYYQSSRSPSSPYQSYSSSSFRNAQRSKLQSSPKKRSIVKPYGKQLKNRQYRLISVSDQPMNNPLGSMTKLIILKDSRAIPFTTVDAKISTPEIESGNFKGDFEEGVGPATSFEPENLSSENQPNSIAIPLRYKRNRINKKKLGREQYGQDTQNYPVYVSPPSDFKPIIYATRRLDGVSNQRSLNGQTVSLPVEGPFPYGVPRGLSSWTLGGPRPFVAGNFWDALGTDEKLINYQSNYPGNYVYRVNSNPQKVLKKKNKKYNDLFNSKKYSQKEGKKQFTPWIFFPSSSFANEPKITSFSNLLPLPSLSPPSSVSSSSSFPSSIDTSSSVMKNRRRPITPGTTLSTERRVTSENNNLPLDTSSSVNSPVAPASAKTDTGSSLSPPQSPSRSSSSDGIRTKLPVGLTSWMFGGVRDLTGKHWDMPEMTVNDNNPNVVPIDGSETPVGYPVADEDVPRRIKDFVDVPEPMMTSDGEYESVDPVVKVLPKETETEGTVEGSFMDKEEPVIYDEEDNQPDSLLFNSIRRNSS